MSNKKGINICSDVEGERRIPVPRLRRRGGGGDKVWRWDNRGGRRAHATQSRYDLSIDAGGRERVEWAAGRAASVPLADQGALPTVHEA